VVRIIAQRRVVPPHVDGVEIVGVGVARVDPVRDGWLAGTGMASIASTAGESKGNDTSWSWSRQYRGPSSAHRPKGGKVRVGQGGRREAQRNKFELFWRHLDIIMTTVRHIIGGYESTIQTILEVRGPSLRPTPQRPNTDGLSFLTLCQRRWAEDRFAYVTC
jgi:hypothetical protein